MAGGIQEQVAGRLRGTFSYLSMGGENLDGIEKEWMMEESRKAPVREGDVIRTSGLPVGWTEIGKCGDRSGRNGGESGTLGLF